MEAADQAPEACHGALGVTATHIRRRLDPLVLTALTTALRGSRELAMMPFLTAMPLINAVISSSEVTRLKRVLAGALLAILVQRLKRSY